MSKQVLPEAFFDSLSVAHKLDNNLDEFRLEEIHLFSYFSSILFLYRKNAISDWAYRYIINPDGYPYSEEIDEAIKRHIQNGLFDIKETFYAITNRGTDEFNTFKELSNFKTREEFLSAACTTSIMVPYSKTLRALLNDPELVKQHKLMNKSWLIQSNVYPKFEEISNSIGVSVKDLIIPAVTWINYIDKI